MLGQEVHPKRSISGAGRYPFGSVIRVKMPFESGVGKWRCGERMPRRRSNICQAADAEETAAQPSPGVPASPLLPLPTEILHCRQDGAYEGREWKTSWRVMRGAAYTRPGMVGGEILTILRTLGSHLRFHGSETEVIRFAWRMA